MEPPPAARDWAGLLRDVLCVVFLKLGTCDIMRGVEFVCTAWRRVALKEPALWRRIYLPTIRRCSKAWRPMLRAALDRAAGQCVAFTGPCDNHSLLDLAERAPSIKYLSLFDFITCNEVLDEALKQLPLLEDLEISPVHRSSDVDDSRWLFHPVCQACPRLKKLVLGHQNVFAHDYSDNGMYVGIGDQQSYREWWSWDSIYRPDVEKQALRTPVMTELRSLELFDCELNMAGLYQILDRCPVLESLHVTGPSVDGEMEEELWEICAGLTKRSLPSHEVPDESDEENCNSQEYDDWN